jgi:hypothetical protein
MWSARNGGLKCMISYELARREARGGSMGRSCALYAVNRLQRQLWI